MNIATEFFTPTRYQILHQIYFPGNEMEETLCNMWEAQGHFEDGLVACGALWHLAMKFKIKTNSTGLRFCRRRIPFNTSSLNVKGALPNAGGAFYNRRDIDSTLPLMMSLVRPTIFMLVSGVGMFADKCRPAKVQILSVNRL